MILGAQRGHVKGLAGRVSLREVSWKKSLSSPALSVVPPASLLMDQLQELSPIRLALGRPYTLDGSQVCLCLGPGRGDASQYRIMGDAEGREPLLLCFRQSPLLQPQVEIIIARHTDDLG
jgi:hypothetical protein